MKRNLCIVLISAILFAGLTGKAQTLPPSANINGPLKVYSNGGDIFLTSEIGADQNAVISYALVNNTSGASIVSKGAYQYNSTTGVGTQTVEINPGSSKGSFNVKLNVTTGGGSTESSKSVTVLSKAGASNLGLH